MGGRDLLLVWAAEPLRSALGALARQQGRETRMPETPLSAIELLIDSGSRISHAWISLGVHHELGIGLLEFLSEEYPAIHCVTLDSPPDF